MENLTQEERQMLQEMVVNLFPEYRYHQVEGEYYKLMSRVDMAPESRWMKIHYLELCIAELPKRMRSMGKKDSKWLQSLVHTMVTGVALNRVQEVIKILYLEFNAIRYTQKPEAVEASS